MDLELTVKELPHKRYVLAVSGGCDSMVLLDLFLKFHPKENLTVSHFNHRVRGEASDRDAAFVERFCLKQGVAFFLGQRAGTQKSEAALRKERFHFLEKCRKSTQSDSVVLAHHADDNLETFFLRLLRGTSMDGLAAIRRKRGKYLRPFLSITKASIRNYAKRNHIPFHEDETNSQGKIFRNRIRKELIPAFKKLAKEHGGEEEFFHRWNGLLSDLQGAARREKTLRKRLFPYYFIQTPFWDRLERTGFLMLSERRKKLLLKEWSLRVLNEPMCRNELNEAINAIKQGKAGISLKGFSLVLSCNQIFFITLKPPIPQFNKKENGWNCPELPLTVSGVKPQLQLRFFQAGDFMGKTKLKKTFLARRIPKLERPLIPVAVVPGTSEVVWHPFLKNHDVTVKTGFPFSVAIS